MHITFTLHMSELLLLQLSNIYNTFKYNVCLFTVLIRWILLAI